MRCLSTKKIFIQISLLIALVITQGLEAAELTIEDRRLKKLPAPVSQLIRSSDSYSPYYSLHCDVIGAELFEVPANDERTYFITTSNACGWGANIGPIWLAKSSSTEHRLLLSTGGYSLRTRAGHDKENITIAFENGGVVVEKNYTLEDGVYKEEKSNAINFGSKSSCCWAEQLQARGYAADSAYAAKLKGVISAWRLE
ncbi:hypothetical protein ACA097_07710 [Pseudomonas sp. QL9]|uniref:hypothetical protein n=1 Tax=Pseudomonas sp. QL9 TaxID=3242725 RepID=UPI00352A7284